MSETFSQGGMGYLSGEPGVQPEKIACNKCSGNGQIFVSHIQYPETTTCLQCGGSGKMDNPKLKKNIIEGVY